MIIELIMLAITISGIIWMYGHHWCRSWSDVDNKGHQYCKVCNKAVNVPCNHTWEVLEKHNIVTTAWIVAKNRCNYQYISKCIHCGELKHQYFEI